MSEAKALLRLQELDTTYSQLKHNAETLPQIPKLAELQAQSKKVHSELKKIVIERKDLEIEISDNEVHKKLLSDKVTEVQSQDATDHRSAANMEESLSMLAKKLEKNEFQTNQLLERLEVVERAEANATKVSQNLKEQIDDLTLSYKLALEKIAKQVKDNRVERAEITQSLSAETLEKYEAAVKRFGGIAVETISSNKPSACRVSLQESQYNQVRRSKTDITTCPYCRRILVLGQE